MGNLADIAKVENFSKLTHSRSTTIAVGRYNEVRAIYLSDSFASTGMFSFIYLPFSFSILFSSLLLFGNNIVILAALLPSFHPSH